MKKLILFLLFFTSINLFAQDWDDDEQGRGHHKKEKYNKDYFSLGLYGGYYLTNGFVSQGSASVNSITLEAEYVQTENWAFYVKEILGIMKNEINSFLDVEEYNAQGYTISNFKAPSVNILSGNFGIRYYVRNKKFNPYFQLGLSNQDFYIGEYSYKLTYPDGAVREYKTKQSNHYNLSLAFGGGVKIKLNHKLAVDLQCDMYRSITEKQTYYQGATFLAGLKYNL